MITLLWCLLASHLLIVLAWFLGVMWVHGLRADEEMQVRSAPDLATNPNAPSLTVFIAAHNEQERIGSCLDRLLSQNYGNLNVIVVNDRSDDTTSERVRAVMANDSRISLVEVDHLPDGWIGKTHALTVAVADVQSDYLLFMDCDCRLVPGAIAAVMKKVTTEEIEFVSLWPRLELLSWSERLLTPAASWLLGLWAILNTKRGTSNSEVKLGNGQFMLFSRNAYEQVGGHASVQAELAEDMILANKVAKLDLKRWAGLGKGLYVTSRENNFSNTCNALTRVLIGSLVKPWRMLCSTQLLLGGIVLPLWLLPLSLILGAVTSEPVYFAFAATSIVHILLMTYVVRRLFVMTLEVSPSVFYFMFGSVIVVGLLVWAWLVMTGRQQVRWGKTSYRVQGSQIVQAIPEPTGSIPTR